MSVFRANCPYCGTKEVAFTILCEERLDNKGHWDTFAKCGYCDRGIVATFDVLGGRAPSVSLKLHLLGIAPPLPDTGAPDYTPENVARFFEQAIDNLPKNWDAAGSMFRKALDTGLKSKFPEMKGTLYNRIEEAAKKQDLTPALAEWAHQIRLGGNDAAHEEEPISKNDAERAILPVPPQAIAMP